MKLSKEVREDAKKYNAEWEIFEGYNHDTGESTYYMSYGVAYRYTSAKVRRGANMSILGHRWVDDPSSEFGGDFETRELICC